MPEKAKVFIAEDDLDWQARIERWLSRSNHEVISTAQTLDQALEAINDFVKNGVQVAILDGNLGRRTDNSDGKQLAAAIKEIAPQVKTIGLPSLGYIPGVDINLGKGNVSKIGEIVTNF